MYSFLATHVYITLLSLPVKLTLVIDVEINPPLGELFTCVFSSGSCLPLANQVIVAAGLLFVETHFNVTICPALASLWPEILTFFGGTEKHKQNHLWTMFKHSKNS